MSSTNISEAKSSPKKHSDKRARRYISIMALRAASDRVDNDFLPESFLELTTRETAIRDDTALLPPGRTHVRPDIAAAAILLARSIEALPNLTREFRRATPCMIIATGRADLVEPVAEAFRGCVIDFDGKTKSRYAQRRKAWKRALLIKRDGTEKSKNTETDNELVRTAIFENRPIVGVSPVPDCYLPNDLVRAADFISYVSALDNIALSLIVETITGTAPTLEIPSGLAAQADMSDLCLAIRAFDKPNQCILRLQSIVAAKQQLRKQGPALEDLPGYGAAKEWGLNLASDLRAYKAGALPWASIDRGLLLDGPPGVGKTQFAKALARSAGVPLVTSSVAQWNAAAHLGATLTAIKDSFNKAQAMAPCIFFIDEIDGVSDRARLQGDYVEYWTQIVNLLLELLSGIEDRPGVVVIGASNNCERIDPAIRRAGRLDRTLAISRPGTDDLVQIFRFHLGPDLQNTDLIPIALAARGRTGADVEAYVRRARSTARRLNREMRSDDIQQEIGSGLSLPRLLKKAVSVHEAGHVVVETALRTTPEMVHLTDTGGTTIPKIAREIGYSVCELEKEISILLAGYAAEKVLLGDDGITYGSGTGDASDLAKATQLAFDIEAKYGLGDCGLMRLPDALVSARFHEPLVQTAIQRRLGKCLEQAESVLQRNQDAAWAIANALHERGYLDGATMESLLTSHRLQPAG